MSKYLLWSIEENAFVEVDLPDNTFVEGFTLHKARYLTPKIQSPEEIDMTPIPIETLQEFQDTGLLKLPAGDWSIDQQIEFDRVSGLRVCGAGMSYNKTALPYDKQVTRLFWTGAAGTPWLKAKVRHGVFEDIQICDAKTWVFPESGFGTGLCYFNRVGFFGADAGIIFGDVSFNGNAADSKVRDCQFVNCDTCIETTTAQNVNYVVDGGLFYRCDEIFRVTGGGLMTVRDSYLTQTPLIFNITGDGTLTGSQNHNFAVRDVKYDASQDTKPLIVQDTGSYGTNRELSILNIHEAPIGLDYINSTNASWVIQDLSTVADNFVPFTP